jgi:hypothetical protein
MPSYHFSLGNSTVGPVGFCARIYADTPDEAVHKLSELLEGIADGYDLTGDHVYPGIGYAEAYFNPDAVTVQDIDEIEDQDPETPPRPSAEQAILDILSLLDHPSLDELLNRELFIEHLRQFAQATGITLPEPADPMPWSPWWKDAFGEPVTGFQVDPQDAEGQQFTGDRHDTFEEALTDARATVWEEGVAVVYIWPVTGDAAHGYQIHTESDCCEMVERTGTPPSEEPVHG